MDPAGSRVILRCIFCAFFKNFYVLAMADNAESAVKKEPISSQELGEIL